MIIVRVYFEGNIGEIEITFTFSSFYIDTFLSRFEGSLMKVNNGEPRPVCQVKHIAFWTMQIGKSLNINLDR